MFDLEKILKFPPDKKIGRFRLMVMIGVIGLVGSVLITIYLAVELKSGQFQSDGVVYMGLACIWFLLMVIRCGMELSKAKKEMRN